MIVCRPAQLADTRAISEVYIDTWRSTYAGTLPDHVLVGMKADRLSSSFARALEHRTEIIMVADHREHGIMAMGSAGRNRGDNATYSGEVYTLYVHPDFQNQGMGETLMAHLFRALAEAGHTSALIWVLAPNPSRFFYERMGGQRAGERREMLWGTTLREWAYGWTDLKKTIHHKRPRLYHT
ncbi:MAG: GNAT family N-acetyltransferase [Rhodospirillaceae bacterium]|nr:GNAT family N-acetyltransferase [Rhodospirillaceae bacterium]